MPSSKRPGEEIEGAAVQVGGWKPYDNGDFAGSARKKLAGSTRTGQACDRCKVRKIRCDARPGGCSPCVQNSTECKTTDRITGRATSRGHTETLENENAALRMYMVELQQQLREKGVDPKPPPDMSQGLAPLQSYYNQNEHQQGSWGDISSSGLVPGPTQKDRHGSQSTLLPDFRPGCIGDNYLGVSSGNEWLSPIEGTQLTLFGMRIDIAEFLPPESDPASDPLSYQTFLFHAFRKSEGIYIPPLPSYDVCKILAEWYFKNVQVFVPLLHKPDFMNLLYRIHHEQYQPNAAETVMVHMVTTIMNFQKALRNRDEQARVDAMAHFHYSLSFIPDLISGHQLEDLQALGVICSQLRNQPRLGAAWMFTNMVLGLAVELGLHRSANAWQTGSAERDPHVIEMRKRTFWSILLIHVNISGKLGRPMPVRLEDVDIELPEHISDSIPGENYNTKWAKCSFRAGIQGQKLLKILMQVYTTIYSIRSGNEPYEVSMRNIQKELEKWKAQLPAELAGGAQTAGDDRCPALYLETAVHEIRLLLHHPSLAHRIPPQVVLENLDICLDASKKMLSAALRLKALKSLDTTWYYTADYLAAIFTTLFAFSQRQDQMTSAESQQLRQDMDAWLGVMGDIGSLLGTGPRLREAIRPIIDTTFANINRNLAARTASAGLATAGSPTSPIATSSQSQVFSSTNGFHNTYSDGRKASEPSNGVQQPYSDDRRVSGNAQHPAAYSITGDYYSETPAAHMQPYIDAFNPSCTSQDAKPNIDMQLHTPNPMVQPQISHQHPIQQDHNAAQLTSHQAPAPFMTAFQSPSAPNGFHPVPPTAHPLQPVPAAWRHFADNMAENMGGQDYMSSANALMALQNDKQPSMDMSAAAVANMGGMHLMPDGQQPWPFIYNTGAVNGQ